MGDKRTSVDVDEDLLEHAKIRAIKNKETLKDLFTRALRKEIEE